MTSDKEPKAEIYFKDLPTIQVTTTDECGRITDILVKAETSTQAHKIYHQIKKEKQKKMRERSEQSK